MMEAPLKHTPFWFGLDDPSIRQLAQEVLNDRTTTQPQDDNLCKQCQDIRLDSLFSGARCPSEEFNLWKCKVFVDDYEARWEADPLIHIRSVRAVRTIARRKSCAICHILTNVHERAHPNCNGKNEQCILLPVRGDRGISIVSGKLSIIEGPEIMVAEDHDHQYATNVHVLFRSRPPGTTQLDSKTNSHFRDEEERWIFRLDVRDAVDERLCYNHAAESGLSINWTNLKTWLTLCTSTADSRHFTHERCHNNELYLNSTLEIDKKRRIKEGPPLFCINIDPEKLVQISLEDHFVALSYVWGAVKVPRNDVLNGDTLNMEKLPKLYGMLW
jgi:hypothetical protein